LKQASCQRALRRFGDVEDGLRRYRNRDLEPRPVVPAPAHDGWDEWRQLLASVVADVIVHQPCQMREQGMGAGGMIAPPLTGEHRGEFHEARAASWRSMPAT
jgi:hypothetical protein